MSFNADGITRSSGLPPSPTNSSASPQAAPRCVKSIAAARRPPSPSSDADCDRDDDPDEAELESEAEAEGDSPFDADQIGRILVFLETLHSGHHILAASEQEQEEVHFALTSSNHNALLKLLDPFAPSSRKNPRLRRLAAWASDTLRYSYSARRQQFRLRMSLSDIHQVFLEDFKQALCSALEDATRAAHPSLSEHERVRPHPNPKLQLADGEKRPDAVITLDGRTPWVVLEVGYTHATADSDCRSYLEDAYSDVRAVIRANIKPVAASQQRLHMPNDGYSVMLDCWYLTENTDEPGTFFATRRFIRAQELRATDTSEGSIDIHLRYLDDRWQNSESRARIQYRSIRAALINAVSEQRRTDQDKLGSPPRNPRPIKRGREATPETPEESTSSFESTEEQDQSGDSSYKGSRVHVSQRAPLPKRLKRRG